MMLSQSYKVTENEAFKEAVALLQAAEDEFAVRFCCQIYTDLTVIYRVLGADFGGVLQAIRGGNGANAMA